jgi:hypothetical protein
LLFGNLPGLSSIDAGGLFIIWKTKGKENFTQSMLDDRTATKLTHPVLNQANHYDGKLLFNPLKNPQALVSNVIRLSSFKRIQVHY